MPLGCNSDSIPKLTNIVTLNVPWCGQIYANLGLFRHGQMIRAHMLSAYSGPICGVPAATASKVRSATLLELGPGDSIATAIIAAMHGSRAVLVDAGAFVRTDIAPYSIWRARWSKREWCRQISAVAHRWTPTSNIAEHAI